MRFIGEMITLEGITSLLVIVNNGYDYIVFFIIFFIVHRKIDYKSFISLPYMAVCHFHTLFRYESSHPDGDHDH